jgi:hypothetical protein
MAHNYKNQFGPEFTPPASILALVDSGAIADTSWGNDTCPSFEAAHGVNTLRLFVEAERVEDREMGDIYPRFQFYDCSDPNDDERPTFGTDDEAEALAALKMFLASGVSPAPVG